MDRDGYQGALERAREALPYVCPVTKTVVRLAADVAVIRVHCLHGGETSTEGGEATWINVNASVAELVRERSTTVKKQEVVLSIGTVPATFETVIEHA